MCSSSVISNRSSGRRAQGPLILIGKGFLDPSSSFQPSSESDIVKVPSPGVMGPALCCCRTLSTVRVVTAVVNEIFQPVEWRWSCFLTFFLYMPRDLRSSPALPKPPFVTSFPCSQGLGTREAGVENVLKSSLTYHAVCRRCLDIHPAV